ncbi:MAG: NAD(P)/FAD-dependent oxidoreductase [Eubacteriales bacterium]|nr:NAD(P)/FAD-dependent oxidoreductase [Eubacteriales bacterium]
MQNIIVIGGGASGMAAAITAARAGADVTILEQNDMLGKKILSTGNGRCNLTNRNLKKEYYHGDNPQFVQDVLSEFGLKEALDFFDGLGIDTKCRGEYVYPLCDQASAVREALVMELKHLGVHVMTECSVKRIDQKGQYFRVFNSKGELCCKASRVILSTGSRASEVSGSDGSGYGLAKQMGHSLSPVVPALVQLRARETYFKKLAGIRTTAEAALLINGKMAARDTGELQLTNYGLSGIPVFQISRYAAKALQKGKEVKVRIDFIPHISKDIFLQEILKRRVRWGRRTAEELLNTLFPSKLIPVLLAEAGIGRTLWAEKISEHEWMRFAELCKSFVVDIADTNPFEKAQICAGGVRTEELSSGTMESKLVSGLYITGELLDVDGICGGYNLHFAWASGALAGMHAAK